MKKLTRILLVVSGIAFLLNLIWENLQMPLYQSYINFWQHFPICSVAAFGDILIIAFIYSVFATLKENTLWVTKMSITDKTILMVMGALIAVLIEKWALGMNRWQYTSAMPLIPYLGVGLSPILQMAILPGVSFWLGNRFVEKYG